MEIILLERIEKLGQMGDKVRVKDGYARNFLLPHGKALRATKANRERFERDRQALEARNDERKAAAAAQAATVDGKTFTLIRQAGESGQLYGSVSTRDIAETVADAGGEVHRNQVVLDRPIKGIGLYDVRVILHPEVSVTITVNVARTQDEANAQARGEDLTIPVDEREAARIEAEELFESEELAMEAEEELAEEPADTAAEAGAEETDENRT